MSTYMDRMNKKLDAIMKKENTKGIGENNVEGGKATNHGENNGIMKSGDATDSGYGGGYVKGGDTLNNHTNNHLMFGGNANNDGVNNGDVEGGDSLNDGLNNNRLAGGDATNNKGAVNTDGSIIKGGNAHRRIQEGIYEYKLIKTKLIENKNELKEKQHELDELKSQYLKQELLIEKQSQQLRDKDNSSETIKELEGKLLASQTTLDGMGAEKDSLLKQLTDKESQVNALTHDLAAKNAELVESKQNLSNERKKFSAELTEMKNEKISLKTDIDSLKKEKGNLNDEYVKIKNEKNRSKDELVKLKNERNAVNDKLSIQTDSLNLIKATLAKKEDELKKTQSELNSQKSKNEHLIKLESTLKDEIKNLKMDLVSKNTERNASLNMVTEIRIKIETLKSENKNLNEKLKTANESIKELNEKMVCTEKKLKCAEDKLKETREELKETKNINNQLNVEINEYKELSMMSQTDKNKLLNAKKALEMINTIASDEKNKLDGDHTMDVVTYKEQKMTTYAPLDLQAKSAGSADNSGNNQGTIRGGDSTTNVYIEKGELTIDGDEMVDKLALSVGQLAETMNGFKYDTFVAASTFTDDVQEISPALVISMPRMSGSLVS